MYDYTAQNDDELPFGKGQIINVLSREDPDWWKGELNGSIGLFPSNYVKLTTDTDPSQQCEYEKGGKKAFFSPFSVFFLSIDGFVLTAGLISFILNLLLQTVVPFARTSVLVVKIMTCMRVLISRDQSKVSWLVISTVSMISYSPEMIQCTKTEKCFCK